MKTSTWMLELGRTSWRLYVRRHDEAVVLVSAEFTEETLVDQAHEVSQALASEGYHGEAIVLAIESLWCLSASIPINRPQDLRDRQAMLYRLEEAIPWSAEEIVADFAEPGDTAFSVVVPIEPLRGFLNGLTACGIETQNIVPFALLAAYAYASECESVEPTTLIIANSGWTDIVTVSKENIISWACMPASTEAIRRHLTAAALEQGSIGAVVGIGVDANLLDELKPKHDNVQVIVEDRGSVAGLAISAATKLVDGSMELPIELKRGPFGRSRSNSALRRPMMALQFAAATLVISLTMGLFYRGHACSRQAIETTSRQADVFEAVFPNAKVPTGIATRLRSELTKFKGLRGDDASLPSTTSAIVVLKDLLAAVPADKRIRLLEIRIENGRLYLDGETRAHSDAELLAQRLRGQGFEASSPKTQRLDDQRVSLRITALHKLSSNVATGARADVN